MGAIALDLGQRRPCQEAALRPGMPLAERLVVGVEEILIVGIEGTIAGGEARQDEGLEEPGGVGEMPLRRAGERHRLDLLVLGAQRRGQRLGGRSHGRVERRDFSADGARDLGHVRSSRASNGFAAP
jgi:hypothetical protein